MRNAASSRRGPPNRYQILVIFSSSHIPPAMPSKSVRWYQPQAYSFQVFFSKYIAVSSRRAGRRFQMGRVRWHENEDHVHKISGTNHVRFAAQFRQQNTCCLLSAIICVSALNFTVRRSQMSLTVKMPQRGESSQATDLPLRPMLIICCCCCCCCCSSSSYYYYYYYSKD